MSMETFTKIMETFTEIGKLRAYVKANEALTQKRDVVYFHLPPAKELKSFDHLAEALAPEQEALEKARRDLGLNQSSEIRSQKSDR